MSARNRMRHHPPPQSHQPNPGQIQRVQHITRPGTRNSLSTQPAACSLEESPAGHQPHPSLLSNNLSVPLRLLSQTVLDRELGSGACIMASLLRWTDKYMKERLQGISCSSAASTSVIVASGRAIDRHSPHLRDPHRRLPPSLPKPPSSPSSGSARTTKDSPASSSSLKQQQQLYYGRYGDGKEKRKKKATPSSAAGGGRSSTLTEAEHKKNKKKAVQLQQVSPASSSRFLLNSSRLTMQSDDDITVVEEALPPPVPPPRPYYFIDEDEDEDIFPNPRDAVLLPLPPVVSPMGPQLVASPVELSAEPPAVAGSSSSGSSSEIGGHDKTAMVRSCSTRATGQNQVVVLRVSLHCKGCAGKVKKHISKMEGVTSFDIDIAAKKVTVVGDVTPLGVLNSISKVKSAQFWTDYSLSTLSTPPRASASF